MEQYLFDSDDVDHFVLDLEQSFGLSFGTHELQDCRTLGDVHDVLVRRTGASTTRGPCPSAMTFYRLRQALVAEGADRELVRRDTPLAVLVGRHPVRWRRKLAKRLRLAIPRFELGAAGCAALLAGVAAIDVLFLRFDGHLYLAAGILAISVALWRIDPGRLPASLQTFGDLVEAIARRNFGALLTRGARRMPDDLWQALAAIARDNASGGTTKSILPETFLFDDARRRRAA